MKKNVLKFATLVVVSFMIACSGGAGPKGVAENFLKATQAEKFDEAKKYCTDETGKLLDMMSSFAKMGEKEKNEKKVEKKFVMGEEKIDGDNATVTYKMEGKEDAEQTIKMKKVDGKWKVAISKDDMSKKGGGSPKDGGMDNNAPASDAPVGGNDTTVKK